MPSKGGSQYSIDTQKRAALVLLEKLRNREDKDRKLPWRPNPGAQTLALFSKADELFFGGAAGGGKTDLLLGAAATVQYKSVIFRRQFPQLRDILSRSREIYAAYPSARYYVQEHTWQLPYGRTLELGSMPLFDDREKYQGRVHDLKAWDEITQFEREQYTYNLAWNRSTRIGQRCRAICTGNPPTSVDGEWVIAYWGPWIDKQHPNPASAGELRWFATVAGKQEEVAGPEPFLIQDQRIEPRSRSYVPSRLTDNPYLRDTGYSAVVNAMPEPLRSLLLFGFEANLPEDIDPWAAIPLTFIDISMGRWRRVAPNAGTLPPISSVGVDTARGGTDTTVIAIKRGNYIERLRIYAATETPNGDTAANKVIEALGLNVDDTNVRGVLPGSIASRIPINLDIIGANGASCYDSLKRLGFNAYAVHPNVPSNRYVRERTLKTFNLRAEMYWLGLREAIDPDYGSNLFIPDDRELRQELAATRWALTSQGSISLIPKEAIEKRLGRSPDRADAVAIACLQMEGRGRPAPPPSVGGRSYGVDSVPLSQPYSYDEPGGKPLADPATADSYPTPQGFDPDRELVYVEGVGMVPANSVERIMEQISGSTRFRVR